MNLRAQFQSLLNQYGHYVLLLRKDNTKKCSCWNDSYGTADKTCHHCLGLGYLFTLEKIKVRTRLASSRPETVARIVRSLPPADILIESRLFFTFYNVTAQSGDLIITVDWNGDRPIIGDYTVVYEVGYTEPERGSHGRIEFMKIFCKADPVEHTFRLQDIIARYNAEHAS